MARFSKIITTIDSHTAGEGTRLVTAGLPPLLGETMAEKLAYAQEQLAWVPGLLLREPRGHKDLFGAVLVPPCAPEADAGLVFMDNTGYEPMCGHAVIGIVTSLLETGSHTALEPETRLTLDTPAGLVRASAQVQDGVVQAVTFENVPAFVWRQDIELAVPQFGNLTVDVAFGGNFFFLVDATQLEIELIPANAARLAGLGMRILAAGNDQIAVRHPQLPHIDRIIDLRFYMATPGRAHSRNVVILGDHMVDRSPCGTGTCAEMALRHTRGELDVGQDFVSESIIGTRFTGRIVAETSVGAGSDALDAVRPRITGRAHITGLQQLVLQPRDPFPQGFVLA
jgi:proline racemase/trans-L-3-hydroxyproline dehydratase